MALNKPNVGQSNWGPTLNAALDYLNGRIDDLPAGATGPQGPAGPTGPTGPAGSINVNGGSANSIYVDNQSINGGTAGSF